MKRRNGYGSVKNIALRVLAVLLLISLLAAGCGKKQEAFPAETEGGGAEGETENGTGSGAFQNTTDEGDENNPADSNGDRTVAFSSESLERWVRYSLRYKIEEGEPLTEKMLQEMTELTVNIESETEAKEVVFLKEDMERLLAVNKVSIMIKPEASGEWVEGYENLKYLPNLETLLIEDGAVEDFDFLQDCSSLKSMTVMENELPENFLDHCHKLERIQIYNCILPEKLCHDCPELKSLTVMGSVDEPDIFAHLTGLEEIVMSETGLDSLEFVRKMKNLKTLCVRNNRIHDISPVLELPCLEKLYINDNELAAFDWQKLPRSLLWLAIGGNQDVTMPSEIFTRYSVAELWHDKEQNLELYAEELKQSQNVFDLHSLEGQWTEIAAEGDIVFGELTDVSKCEIDDCFMGDINGDGMDDLGVIVNAVDEYGPCGRWLYLYPKRENGYGEPYEPITLGIPGFSGAAWSDAVSGAVICDERLVIQQVSGTSTSNYYTSIYCHDEKGWKKETEVTTMFSFVSDGIIQSITDYHKERVTKYMYGRNEEGDYEKICTGDYGFDENPYIGMPVFRMEHTDFQVYSRLKEMPFSTTRVLETVIQTYFAGDDIEKVQNDPVLVKNYEKIFGIDIPDYYYLVQRDDCLLAVHFEGWTEEEEEPVYEITAEYYDKDKNAVTAKFESHRYNALTGEEMQILRD